MIVEEVPSKTVKLRSPNISEQAIYFTMSKEWLFLNSKDMTKLGLITPLLSAYSFQLRNGVAISSVIRQMKKDFDQMGGYYTPTGEVQGLVYHLALLLEKYYAHI